MSDGGITCSGGVSTAKVLFGLLVGTILAVGASHWYALAGLDSLYLGVPLWLWLQLVVVAGLLALAWVAVELWTAVNDLERRSTAGGPADRDGEEGW
jgi:hypothetical protein